jgi:hypothetical protein
MILNDQDLMLAVINAKLEVCSISQGFRQNGMECIYWDQKGRPAYPFTPSGDQLYLEYLKCKMEMKSV